MTDTEREYLERNHPELLRRENEGSASEFVRNNEASISEWIRNNPETNEERWRRERHERENEGAGGW